MGECSKLSWLLLPVHSAQAKGWWLFCKDGGPLWDISWRQYIQFSSQQSPVHSFYLAQGGGDSFIISQSCKFWELWSTEIAIPCIRAAFQYEEVDKFENRKPCRLSATHPERTPLFFPLQRRRGPFPCWKVKPEFQKKDKSILMLMGSEVKNLLPFGGKQDTFQLLFFLFLSWF